MSNIIVYGMGKTGKSMGKLLTEKGNSVIYYDDNKNICNIDIASIDFNNIDEIVVSPGIKPDCELLKKAKDMSIKIVCELQYCFDLFKGKCVSVTGTNGKTTVTQMIDHILKKNGKSSYLLGNGGVPFSSYIDKLNINDIAVLESSSFQLMYTDNFQPYVSLITNIAPDHLDYHKSIDEYISAKLHNCKFQLESQYAIFNADDIECCKLAKHTKAQKFYYSINNNNADCFLNGNEIILRLGENLEKCVMGKLENFSDINLSNALGAILVASKFGINLQESINALSSFVFDKHRMQVITKHHNITYIDDSKATNVHACINAIKSVHNKVVVILGGSDKGECYKDIFTSTNLYGAVLMGDTSNLIAKDAQAMSFDKYIYADYMRQAVLFATDMLDGKEGTVLLSPACASFDKYNSYAQRGDDFQKVVRELECSENK